MKNNNRFKLLVIICAVLFAAIKTPDVDAAIISSDYSWKLSTSLPGGAPTNTNGFYIYSTTLENTFGSTARKMSPTYSLIRYTSATADMKGSFRFYNV